MIVWALNTGLFADHRTDSAFMSHRWTNVRTQFFRLQRIGTTGSNWHIFTYPCNRRVVANAASVGNNVRFTTASSGHGQRDEWWITTNSNNVAVIHNRGRSNMRLQSHSVANRKISPGERITLGVNTGNIPQTQQWGFFRVPPYPTGTNATKSTRAQFRIATSHIRYMFDRTSAEPRNRISSRYGPRPGVNPINHLGVDFAGNGVNRFTEIRAVYHGRVVWRSTSSSADTGFAIAYELDDVICLVTRRQLIVIKMHLQDNPDVAGTNRPRLVVGSRVVPGQIVGRVGSTGNTGGNPHLCFEVTNAPSGNIWNTSGTHARGYSNRINPLYLFYPRITFTDGSQSSTQCRFWDEEARYRADNNGRTTSCINNSTSCVARIERDGGHDRRRY